MKMKLKLNDKTYKIHTEKNELTESIQKLAPFSLTLSRSADHEYYASLPGSVKTGGAQLTSHVRKSGIYYFEAWNAFSVNFRDLDISPYKVYVIGEAEQDLSDLLSKSGSRINIEIVCDSQ